jgi:hypothetical protein
MLPGGPVVKDAETDPTQNRGYGYERKVPERV